MKDFKQNIEKLRSLGLRPTRQRLIITEVLFGQKETFHFTIEQLYKKCNKNFNVKIAQATVYNTVHAFKRKGYLKEISLGQNKTYYDTNKSNHNHFYDEENKKLIDIKNSKIQIKNIPDVPNNKSVKSIEVIIRITDEEGCDKTSGQ